MRNSIKYVLATTLFLIFVNSLTFDAIGQKTAVSTSNNIKGSDTVFFDLQYDEGTFIHLEEAPKFSNSYRSLIDYIIQKTNYPQTAVNDSTTGTIFITFIVEVDGSTSNIQIIKGIRGDLDDECIRVIKEMPKWQPGRQIQHAPKGYFWTEIRTRFSARITFTLDDLPNDSQKIIIRPQKK